MFVEANNKMMVLRVNQYKDYDIIKEHNKIVALDGCVWILKMGKPIPEKAIQSVIDESGVLILKMPKAQGGKFYYTELIECHNGEPEKRYTYPTYYKEMTETPNYDHDYSLCGSWMKITKIRELSEDKANNLVLVNTGNSLVDVVNTTRTSFMYVRCEENIEL